MGRADLLGDPAFSFSELQHKKFFFGFGFCLAVGWCCGAAMSSPSLCKCLHCREFFVPCSNNRRTQRYCSKAECRKASKLAAQAKWLNKPQNRCYFRGPENVERVRRWREHHPCYWRKKRPPPTDALQDLAPIELSQIEPVTLNEVGLIAGDLMINEPLRPPPAGALQDLASVQVPLLAGVVSLLVGDALQDRFAVFARQLVDRGRRVLAAER
jgi:hypothetical protein